MRHHLPATVKAVDDRGGWTAVANAPSVDRDGERILPRALRWRTPTVPVHIDHVMSTERLVGRCRPYYDAKGVLMVEGTFGTGELAQRTRQMVVDGSLNSMSIAFIDGTRRKGADGVPEITGGELVAVDFVTVPSNADALVLTARSAGRGMTVAEAKAYVERTMADLVRLELADADRVLAGRRGMSTDQARRYLRSI